LVEVRSKLLQVEDDEVLADPELDKKAKKVGAEFITVNAKTGEKKPMRRSSRRIVPGR